MAKYQEFTQQLTDLNHSELVLLAKWCGLPASRAFPRDMLISSLENYRAIELPVPLDDKRQQVSEWLNRWWDKVRMQVPKKVCPNCHLCRDLQVIDCYSLNEHSIHPKRAR